MPEIQYTKILSSTVEEKDDQQICKFADAGAQECNVVVDVPDQEIPHP